MTSCHSNSVEEKLPNLNGDFTSANLDNQEIYKLKTFNSLIYVGSSRNFYVEGSNSTEWNSLGLEGGQIRSFVVFSEKEFLASLYYPDIDSATIAKTTDAGESWVPFQNRFGDNERLIPNSMDSNPNNPAIIFANAAPYPNIVGKSNDKGKSWNNVIASWENRNLGRATFLQLEQSKPNHIWNGGATALSRPVLLKSENGGDDWKGYSVAGVETTVFDLIKNKEKTDHLMVALGGVLEPANMVRRSKDGGENWKTVLGDINSRTFTYSISNPNIIYLSGANTSGSVFFAATADFGDTWKTVNWSEGPTGIIVNDIISVLRNGKEVLYFGTNKGLYRYTFVE